MKAYWMGFFKIMPITLELPQRGGTWEPGLTKKVKILPSPSWNLNQLSQNIVTINNMEFLDTVLKPLFVS
jgi:hypothetical protein